MLASKKLAVLGVGKLGETLITGLLNTNSIDRSQVIGTVRHEASIYRVQKKLDIDISLDNQAAAKHADIVLLAVKPQNMDAILKEIDPYLTGEKLLISVAASVTTSFVEERLSLPLPVVRAMPNTPAVVSAGMTGLCGGAHAEQVHLDMAQSIFNCFGKTVFVDETLMDGVTALSASGPAYVYVVIESLAEAGVKLGIPRDIATLLASQTLFGAAKMVLESNAHPALLKDMVTTPAGCTIDGLLELEEGKLRVTLIKAVVKAAERAHELVKVQDKAAK